MGMAAAAAAYVLHSSFKLRRGKGGRFSDSEEEDGWMIRDKGGMWQKEKMGWGGDWTSQVDVVMPTKMPKLIHSPNANYPVVL
jgi:hypothetical protein